MCISEIRGKRQIRRERCAAAEIAVGEGCGEEGGDGLVG